MDLKSILAANKSKIRQSTINLKPVNIADQDRPYSSDATLIKSDETGNKLVTNREQTGNKLVTNREQTGNTTGNTTGNKLGTNREQTGNKLGTNITFSALIGLQREIIIFMCHECKNLRSRTTDPLTLEYVATALKRHTGVVKTTILRLERKGFLQRVEFKNGRGGWSRYELPDLIYHDVIRTETGNKLVTKWEQSGNKLVTKVVTEPVTSSSSSSSDLRAIKTTTTLGDEWNFDITPYAVFGFTSSHIKQLAPLGVISAADVEQSLVEFSYDLANNALPPIKTGKINFLMGLLRSGHSYVSEGFKDEQAVAIEEMARRAESKRKKLLEDKFIAWESSLTDEKRQVLAKQLPPQLMVLNNAFGISSPEVKHWLFNYFLQDMK